MKNKGLVKARKLVLGLALSICILAPSMKAEAAKTNAAETAKEGVVQVNTVYTDDSGSKHIVCGGTGFIIGNAEETEYVLTCNHLVNPAEEVRNAAFEAFGVSNEDDSYSKINLSYEVVVEGDVSLDANLLTSSEEVDFAVLQLSQPIYTRTPLAFYTAAEGSDEVPYAITDGVYALGFPDGISYDSEVFYYSSDQVSMSAGSIVNMLSLNGVDTIEHTAQVGVNNCGGPLVNEDGNVIGMNTLTTDGVYFCALDGTKIMKILDGLGIAYDKQQYVAPEPEKVEETTEDTATSDNSKLFILIICAVVVVLIAVVVTLIIVLVLKKDKAPEEEKPKKEKKPKKEAGPVINNDALKRFTSDTTVLGQTSGPAETNVLGDTGNPFEHKEVGSLVRKKSGEKISINKSYFLIGKDSLHVDYCIKDNGTISRQHCALRQAKEGVCLEDCNSTNGTFLNGKRLTGGEPQLIRSGDVIRISNEEFEFKAE